MAFASAVSYKTVFGNKRIHMGTYSCASVATGDIDTGLRQAEHVQLTQQGSAVTSTAPVIDEDMPVAGSAVTIVTASSAAGYWMAIGY
jgi:hypothetical protein